MKKLLFLSVALSAVLVFTGLGYAVNNCWDYDTQSTCETNDCFWDSFGNWCSEKGCWNLYDQSSCQNSVSSINRSCNWKTSSSTGWCEKTDCWSFSGTDNATCVGNTYGLTCTWSNSCFGGNNCWEVSDQNTCTNKTGCQWGDCYRQGCWEQTTQSTCEATTGFEGTSCKWNTNGNYCYEPGCWDYANSSVCTTNGCTWSNGYCSKPSCWDYSYTNSSACVNNTQSLSCNWNSPYCEERGCWNYNSEGTCNAQNASEFSCYWKISSNSGWCENVGCWSFEGPSSNQSACESNTANLNCVWDNSSGNGWCYQNVSAISCTSITNEKSCYDTYYCWWDSLGDGGSGSCENPGQGGDDFFEEWNPGCYIFDYNETQCNATLGCSWSGSDCNSNNTVATDGLACGNINSSDLCNSIAALSSCCSWQAGTCEENRFSTSCRDSLEAPPEGAAFCEDWKAYDSQTLCEQIAGDPWYMPCKWDNTTSHCGFNNEKVFGDSGTGGFELINNKQNCQSAGGKWIQEAYCSGNKSVSAGRCEYKFDEETNCNKACFACEKKTDGNSWTSSADARTACQDSALGFCEFRSDTNAPNGFGFCEPKTAFVKAGKSCDEDCGTCTFLGDTLEGEPQAACKASKANCKWIADPADVSKGFCASTSEKSCNDRCDKCYDQNNCVQYGQGGNAACTWDSATLLCKSASGSGNTETCFDGTDNDGDGAIDCADSGCFSDPFCGGGLFGPDCFGYNDNSSCTTAGCAWVTESWGSFCDHAGALCFEYDGTNQSACENSTNVGAECSWSIGFGGGFCEVPEDEGQPCWNAENQTTCEANSQCSWNIDQWCLDNPDSCGGNTGWCDFAAFTCWKNQNQSSCDGNSYCFWRTDEFSQGGGWCDNKCFQPDLNQTTCTSINLTGNLTCEWVSGLCDPKGFGGGTSGGGFGPSCFQYDGNQTQCENQTGCSWFQHGDAFCDVDFSDNCPQFSNNETQCNAQPTCKWTGSWCDQKAFECHWNSSLNSNQTVCDSNPECTWVNDGQFSRCETICFGDTSLNNNQTACNAADSCKWISGFCDPALGASLFTGVQSGAPVPLGSDPDDSGIQKSVDITGFGMKDMGTAYGFGIQVEDISDGVICKGEPLPNGAVGKGGNSTNYFFYLDTDGAKTGNCATRHNASLVGFEFQLRYVVTEDNTTKQASETFTAKKCVNGEWGVSDIKLSSNKLLACNEIGGGMIAIDKADLNKFPTLYTSTADIRVAVATADANGNITNPTDVASPGFGTPGAIDFKVEDCWIKGADADGDGLTSESDPDCTFINKKGFVPFEDCFPNNIDEDGNGLTDCFDYACKDFKYCVDNQLGLNDPDFEDNTAPSITAVKTEEYPDATLIMYDSNEPANGLLQFYRNDSTCTSLNTTIYDVGFNSSTVKEYKVWHEADIYNDGGIYSLNYDLTQNTTYYYKLKLCDDSSNCALSACLNFKTPVNTSCGKCEFVAKVKPPTGWNASYDLDQDGTFDQQGLACGNVKSAGVLTNYSEGRNVDIIIEQNDSSVYIKFINASLSKTVLNDKVRTFSESGNVKAGTTTDSSGSNVGYGGLDSSTRDKLINSLHPEACELKIPSDGNCQEFWHCDDNLTNCANRTADATLVETGSDYCVWRVPFCEFSTWAGGEPGATPSSSSSTSSGGGGGGGGGAASTSNQQTSSIFSVVGGTPQDITYTSSGIDVLKITVTTNTNVDKVSITAKKETSVSVTSPDNKVYSYIRLTSNESNSINKAVVRFRVEKTWFSGNNIRLDDISLMYHKDGSKWIELVTNRDTSTITGQLTGGNFLDKIVNFFSGLFGITGKLTADDYYYYTAETSGLGLFAITGKERIVKTESEETVASGEESVCEESMKRCSGNVLEICQSNSWIRSEICQNGCDSETLSCIVTEQEQETQSTSNVSVLVIVIAILILGGIVYLVYYYSRKRYNVI